MKLKKLISKFKTYVKNVWFKYVKGPLLNKELKKKRDAEIIKIKEEFEKKQKVAVERVKDIMYHEKYIVKNYPKTEYHNEKLLENRQNMINNHHLIKKIPFFYEPDICDIHNETIKDKKEDLKTLIEKSKAESFSNLKQQEKKFLPNLYKRG